jgi:hypothetical protein
LLDAHGRINIKRDLKASLRLFLLFVLGRLQRNLTTAFALTGVLTGATIVATLATALSFALVHAFAIMLGNRRAAALALTRVLARATILATGASSLSFAFIVPLANVLRSLVIRRQHFTFTTR